MNLMIYIRVQIQLNKKVYMNYMYLIINKFIFGKIFYQI